MNYENRVVVTGVGPLSAIGIGKEALWNSVLSETPGLVLKDYSEDDKKIDSFYTYEIKDFDINNFGIEKRFLGAIEEWKKEKEWYDLKYLLAATKLALKDSGLIYEQDDNKVGLILTHENPGLDQFYTDIIHGFHELLLQKNTSENAKESLFFRKLFQRFERQAYDLQTFMFLFHVAKTFDIHGYSLFLNNACASGLYAIETAADVIKSGKCDAVIVAGADRTSIYKQLWFKSINMYPEDGKIKPFAKDRNGFVLGDGGAGIVLESLDGALKRKAHIYAEYLGGGFSLEGWKVAIPSMVSDSYKNAIIQALERGKIEKEQVDLIIPHGVGTPMSDKYEAKAITNVFGKNFQRPLVTAIKPYIGHTLGCSALLETIILLLSLENNMVPPTLNTQMSDEKLDLQLALQSKKTDLKIALKTACGFAGYNAAAVFRKL